VETTSSGSLSLDIALGGGGVPRGRIVEIFGKESSGKTTLALHMLAEVHEAGGSAAFVDAEHALDPKYSSSIGVDLDRLLLSQPNSGEEALEITEQLVRSGALDMVVIDSVAALVPQAELEGEMGDSQVGLQARLMSQAMRKLAGAISQSKTTVVFTNQIRSKINNSPWGPSTTTSGGRALKFYSSVRLNIYITKTLEKDGEKIGNAVTVRVVKNKVAPPFQEANFDIIYGTGISRERELLDLGEEYDVVTRNGSWYSYGDTRLGQGVDNSQEYLEEHPEVAEEIEEKILEEAGLKERQSTENDEEESSEESGE
ncbi:MAG: recombinase RecA, partial [Candidatus Bipolaricaulota bacterium]